MNMFWSIYKNLEKELLDLSNRIHFCDTQDSVYSIHISDLLIRTSVEIEALSKELYKLSGGDMTPKDNDGSERDLFFDSDCIQLLDMNWHITKKRVSVVAPTFYFTKQENLILQPLKNCNKRGNGRWKKAYQAVKHDRLESLSAGNIANLIRAMAALYILNLYYRDEKYDVGTVMNTVPFDTRMGSDVFSATLAHAEKCRFAEEMSDDGIDDAVKAELEHAVYVQKYTDDAFELLHKTMMEYNDSARDMLIHSPEVAQFLGANPDYKYTSLLTLAKDAGGEALANKMMKGQSVLKSIPQANMEVVLNKVQPIYPVLVKR